MRWVHGVIGLGGLLVLLNGCAANDLMVKRQTETETRVEHLFQVAGGVEARMSELTTRLAALEEQDAQRAKLLRELTEGVRELKEVKQALQSRVQAGGVSGTPKVEVVNPEAPVRAKDAGPPAAYLKAFGLYSANNFAAAMTAFEQFLTESPAGEYTPNAHYWIGECYYSTSELSKALISFQKVVDGWPQHPKAADALLKIGYSQAALNQPLKARTAFERLIRQYPGSPATVKARERLMILDNPAL
jgi:tol-pal system protein YbgF